MKKHIQSLIDNPAGISKSFSEVGRGSQILLALLGVQLLIAAALYWQSTRAGQFVAAENVLAFSKSDIDHIQIADIDGEITLERDNNQWKMSGDPVLPADPERVNSILESLGELSAGLPVANNETSRVQLEVDEKTFQRRVKLQAKDDVKAEFFVGSSPGFRKAHFRKAGDSAIYAATLNAFDLPVEQSEWLDKSILAFSEISEIAGEDFKLILEDQQWKLLEPLDIPDNKTLDTNKVAQLVSSLESLKVSDVAEPLVLDENSGDSESDVDTTQADGEQKEDVELKEVIFSIVTRDNKVQLNLQVMGDQAVASREDINPSFAVDAGLVETLSAVSVKSLLVTADETAESGESKVVIE